MWDLTQILGIFDSAWFKKKHGYTEKSRYKNDIKFKLNSNIAVLKQKIQIKLLYILSKTKQK